ncbi:MULTISPECIES: rhodanese-like domain-containing protein [Bacillota]|jgi:phage shock protein E|uniref:Rhodanese-like domain-containing protein n=1 Tax=Amedibacillus hominis TaxID=2897776 RepID=A0ABS9R6R2_9FIRM|nr:MULTISPECIES: rhodanese-like domain-containing protein [Bacillota]MCH4284848.1 rhodanese-like domain-containing protein [Amedibacillus hominis]RGB55073.1 rhodanese-like domain-containing protein [Absiella sp. AM22-9]RGB62662.1 rhodanese-like domain-containing protein [Absiella sp. AM10-20]RGB69522.1 rhodanese-like domain-containing protein [Absiella sp. AM09-45]RGB77710.1 rhodanese-like domain-containing protein [Absiella sp. AM09-50]
MFNFDKTMEEVRADMQDDDVLLVDVREIDEFANGHIPDAINVPLSELDQSAEIMLPKDKKLYVYCRSGQRSTTAKRKLLEMGFEEVYNVGGIISWPYEVETGA